MTLSIAALTERNIALYNALNEIDDRRERRIKAASTGRQEPSSAFGLCDVDDVDDGGRLIERRERGIGHRFIPVSELPAPDAEAIELEQDSVPATIEQPLETSPDELQIEEIRYLLGRTQTPVILRRRSTLRAI